MQILERLCFPDLPRRLARSRLQRMAEEFSGLGGEVLRFFDRILGFANFWRFFFAILGLTKIPLGDYFFPGFLSKSKDF